MSIEQVATRGRAAVEAAEIGRSRTVVFRDASPIAAIVPVEDLQLLEPADPGESGPDPLLSLCGSCRHDVFVDTVLGDFHRTMLFRRDEHLGQEGPPRQ
jgi:hypothetical protein